MIFIKDSPPATYSYHDYVSQSVWITFSRGSLRLDGRIPKRVDLDLVLPAARFVRIAAAGRVTSRDTDPERDLCGAGHRIVAEALRGILHASDRVATINANGDAALHC